jgi:protein-S-isoprenylcysteine O-methyltransferase Ste14
MIVLLSQLLWVAFLAFIITWQRSPHASADYVESSGSRALHLVLVVIGFALMWLGHGTYQPKPAMAMKETLVIAGFVLQAIAVLFGGWARVTLGSNWSSRIRTAGSQKLVVNGPYRMTRHPMYTSFMVAALGSAMIVGRFRAYVGCLFILAAYIRKIRIEERLLEQRFGDEYRQYEEFVPPVLPTKGTDAVAATVKNKQEEKAKQAEEKKEANDQDRRKSA